GLLADLDAPRERRRTLRRQDTFRTAVEHAKAKRRVAGRFAGAVEAVVVLLVPPGQLGAALEQHRAKLGVVAHTRDAKLELRLDGAVSRGAETQARHAGTVPFARPYLASDTPRP